MINLLFLSNAVAQNTINIQPKANIRLSFLLYPFTPLLSFEFNTFKRFTIQLETNFKQTHGVNLKYYPGKSMSGHYWFSGLALLKNQQLRSDEKNVFLPYLGYGFALSFGKRKLWTFDNRCGIGRTINAERNFFFPVVKTGIGRLICLQ